MGRSIVGQNKSRGGTYLTKGWGSPISWRKGGGYLFLDLGEKKMDQTMKKCKFGPLLELQKLKHAYNLLKPFIFGVFMDLSS
jgi:hypothetical protein